MIDNVRGVTNPGLIVNYLHRIYAPYSAFRYHVPGDRLAAYEKAWEILRGTTNKELEGFYKFGDPELLKRQQIVISRLEALRNIAKSV